MFFVAVAASSLMIQDERALFVYLPCFGVGFAVFLFYNNRVEVTTFLMLCSTFVAMTWYNIGLPAAVTVVISAVLILFPIKGKVIVISALGGISYSLYLVHEIIGNRIINLATRSPSDGIKLAGVAVAIVVSLGAAIALWYFVVIGSDGLYRSPEAAAAELMRWR